MAKPRLSLYGVPIFAILWAYLLGSNGFAIDPLVQQRLDKVAILPGQTFNISFSHYAGYIKVNEKAGRALFYWLIEAETDPDNKPLLLWLNGGPGCSSIGFGEAEEIGPFHIKPDGKTLFLNPYSWNKVANILFVDTPAGVGFSYSDTPSDIKNSGDKMTATDNLVFLLEWFKRFPQYKGRAFFISGESYAGHYVPQLSQVIVNHNSANRKDTINLKGYMVGNAVTDDYHDWLGYNQFLWSSGLISDQTYKQLNLICVNDSLIKPSNSCLKILSNGFAEVGNIDLYSIFTPVCPSNTSQSNLVKRKYRIIRLLEGYDPCTQEHSKVYFNLAEVQKALHVDPNHKPPKWDLCSDDVGNSWQDTPRSVLNIYRKLIRVGLRIWVFSGDTDSIVPVTSTRNSINALNLSTVKPWRAWYNRGEVGGWTQEYAGLTFVAVRGAGHEVPLHRPELALTLVKSFLAGAPLPSAQPVAA